MVLNKKGFSFSIIGKNIVFKVNIERYLKTILIVISLKRISSLILNHLLSNP